MGDLVKRVEEAFEDWDGRIQSILDDIEERNDSPPSKDTVEMFYAIRRHGGIKAALIEIARDIDAIRARMDGS